MRILIVDDDRTNRVLLRRFCSLAGTYEVDEAVNGAIAVQMCEAKDYDLIFMDYHMPEMDGVTATQAIRDNAKLQDKMPVIVLATADTSKDLMSWGYKAGADGYLTKPLSREAVGAIVLRSARDVLVREAARVKSAEMEEEAKAAASIMRRMTHSDETEAQDWLWLVEKPSNGIISGDFVCARLTPTDTKRGFLADNMGHGVSAALVNVQLHQAFVESLHLPLPEAYAQINNRLKAVLPTGVYTCGALYEIEDDQLHIINAGLPPLFVGDNVANSSQLPLGIVKQTEPVVPDRFPLDKGAWLYTDGLFDAIPTINGEWFSRSDMNRADCAEFLELITTLDDTTVIRIHPVSKA